MSDSNSSSLNYRDSGVNIDRGNELVQRIKPAVARTQRPGVVGGIGGFGGLFELPLNQYKNPILVSGTDGVGTKLKLANLLNKHDTIGIDLVAMCVNDIIVSGAEPLFFLDYFATGKLDLDQAQAVVEGIADGCVQAGCSLSGGETAEMPGMYSDGEYDLAGFAVGIVEKNKMLLAENVRAGDCLIGLASSGPHSNGYSLIRKILEVGAHDIHSDFNGKPLGEVLLTPTRIYVKTLLQLFQHVNVHALSHITGGGLLENLPRVLPEDCVALIQNDSWQWPPIFSWLEQQGGVDRDEMYRTFNCGVGMVIIVAENDKDKTLALCEKLGEHAFVLGSIEPKQDNSQPQVLIR